MQHFTIKDVENLLGIKAHTLRVWEQRYGFITPQRKESAHRIYTNEDVKRLLRIAFLYHQGWKISAIAALDGDALNEAIASVPLNVNTYTHFVVQLIGYAIDFNDTGFSALLDRLDQEIGFEQMVEDVCFPFLQRVGMLWMTNHLVPAQEHFSSYLIQSKIISATAALPLPGEQPELVLFAPKGEFHELPLVYLHYLLRKNGWRVLFLGKNVGVDILKECLEQSAIQYLYLHLMTSLTQLDPELYLEKLVRAFPGKQVIASGYAFRVVKRSFVNVTLLLSDKDIHRFVEAKK